RLRRSSRMAGTRPDMSSRPPGTGRRGWLGSRGNKGGSRRHRLRHDLPPISCTSGFAWSFVARLPDQRHGSAHIHASRVLATSEVGYWTLGLLVTRLDDAPAAVARSTRAAI